MAIIITMSTNEDCDTALNNNIRLVTLAEHTSDHGKQANSSTKERGSRARKLLGADAKSYRLKLKLKLSRLVSISTDKASTGW